MRVIIGKKKYYTINNNKNGYTINIKINDKKKPHNKD